MAEIIKVDFDEQPRRVDVELLITHPTMDPADITAALGLEATFAFRAGDRRMSPRGVLLGGINRVTSWRHSVRHEIRGQHFSSKVTQLVNRLTPHGDFFADLRATNGRAVVIVQFLGDGYLGDNVPVDTLARMADLQLEFGIECFVVPQN